MSKLENSEIDYSLLSSMLSEALKENINLRKLYNVKSKEDELNAPIVIETLSDLTIIEELEGKLRISGILLAEGIWNGVFYGKEEIKKMYDNFKERLAHMKIIAEHEKMPEFGPMKLGGHTKIEWSDTLGAILYSGEVTNSKAIELIKLGRFKGTSMKLRVKRIPEGMLIKGVDLEPIDNSLTGSPACTPALIVSKEEMNKNGDNIVHNFYGVIKEGNTKVETINIEKEPKPIMEGKISSVELTEDNGNPVRVENVNMTEFLEELNSFVKRKRIIYEYDNKPQSVDNFNATSEFSYQPYNGKFLVIRMFDTEEEAKQFVTDIKGKRIFLSKDEKLAKWTKKYVNGLPDSAFAYISPGGKKDSEGKTVPRSLRHLPFKDANGKVDPAHVRNALARLPITDIPASAKASARSKLLAAAKSIGVKAKMSKFTGKLTVNTANLVWEVTDDYIRSGHGNKANMAPGSFRTINIGHGGIKAIVGCPKGQYEGGKCKTGMKVQSFLFPKSKFTKAQAQSWFKNRSSSSKMSEKPLSEDKTHKEVKKELTEEPKVKDKEVPKEEAPTTTEAPKTKETPKEEPKEEVTEPKVEDKPKVEEVPKAEEPKIEEEKPKEEPKPEVKEVPKEEPKVEPKVEEQPKVEEPKTEPKTVEAPNVEPKEETPKEEPRLPTQNEIVDEIVKDGNLLADLIMKGKIKYGDYDD